MGIQSTVRYDSAYGVPGELRYDGPSRAKRGYLNSASAAYNVIGATAFYQAPAGGAVFAGNPDGTGTFFGILGKPKNYAAAGLSASMVLPNNVESEFFEMGMPVISVPAACKIGDLVLSDNTTGALSTVAPVASFTAAIAITTGIMTVSAITAGSVGIGTVIKDPTTGAILARISALIASTGGVGGTGTYQTDIITAVSSQVMTADTVAAVGKTIVPKTVIYDVPQTASSAIACAKMTN